MCIDLLIQLASYDICAIVLFRICLNNLIFTLKFFIKLNFKILKSRKEYATVKYDNILEK